MNDIRRQKEQMSGKLIRYLNADVLIKVVFLEWQKKKNKSIIIFLSNS